MKEPKVTDFAALISIKHGKESLQTNVDDFFNAHHSRYVAVNEKRFEEIKQRYKNQSDRKIFDSLPEAGPQLASRIMVAFGSNRSHYQSANDIQKYAGIAPVIEQSG